MTPTYVLLALATIIGTSPQVRNSETTGSHVVASSEEAAKPRAKTKAKVRGPRRSSAKL